MPQCQYDIQVGKFEQLDALIKELNALGSEDWEAVSFAADDDGENFTVLLKRPVPKKSGPKVGAASIDI